MKTLEMMNKEADAVIFKWSAGGMLGNALFLPPFDYVAEAAAMAKMGYEISKVYGLQIGTAELKEIAKTVLKGIGAVGTAGRVALGILKYVPGVNVGVLFIQPPLVAALSYATGKTYKNYCVSLLVSDRKLTNDEIKRIAKQAYTDKRKEKTV